MPFWCLLCVSSGQGTGHFNQVWSKSNVGKNVKKTCCKKEKEKEEEEEEEEEETSKIQDPAATPAG